MSRSGTTSYETATGSTRSWKVILTLGVVSVVIGLILLLNIHLTALVIALLVGLTLVIAGVERIVNSGQAGNRALAILIGVAGILLGVFAVASPGVTLVGVALAVGIGLIVAGVADIALGTFAPSGRSRGWLLLTGVLDVVIGVLALAWPVPTIIVVCLVFGIRTIVAGVADIGYALSLRRLSSAGPTSPGRAVPA